MNTNNVWQKTLDQIKNTVSFSDYNLFFLNTCISSINNDLDKNIIIISCQNYFAKQTLEKKYKKHIKRALDETMGINCTPEFIIHSKGGGQNIQTGPGLFSQETNQILSEKEKENQLNNLIRRANLKPQNTFQNFAVSPTNEVAFAAATAVAKNPGDAYNPLFIYGDVGVGKTHLMQAIGIKLLEENPRLKLIFCPGEQFTNEIIEAIRNKKTPSFREKYRKVDVLLVDDIQFIAGKNTVQEEFFHTFNTIKAVGGQIILTSDRPPQEIKLLEDRLRSRFEEGLNIDIQQPNFELRTAILLIKSKQMGQELPLDIAQDIAQEITSTRKLQGFLTKLFAHINLRNAPISKEIVMYLLKKDLPEENRLQPMVYVSPKEVIKKISKYYDIPLQLILGPRRSKPIVVPRQYAMYLLKTDLKISYVEIGHIFGDRDHTTVMHAVDKVSQNLKKTTNLQAEISELRKQIYT